MADIPIANIGGQGSCAFRFGGQGVLNTTFSEISGGVGDIYAGFGDELKPRGEQFEQQSYQEAASLAEQNAHTQQFRRRGHRSAISRASWLLRRRRKKSLKPLKIKQRCEPTKRTSQLPHNDASSTAPCDEAGSSQRASAG
jgi:hypothetical protein